MESIMVLDGESRAVLAVVRHLGRRGVPVFVGGSTTLARAKYSKYCRKGFTYHSSRHGTEAMHRDILQNVKRLRPDVIFPFGSETTQLVLDHSEEYEKHCRIVPMLDAEKFKLFNDKGTMIREASRVGCSIPKTYFPKDLGDAGKLSLHLDYPALIKPRTSSTGKGIIKVHSPRELAREYALVSKQRKEGTAYDPSRPVIQEFIPGTLNYTVVVLFDHGRHMASIVNQNHRYYPVPFGPPIFNETVLNERIRRIAVDMFRKLKWHGTANVNFMIDPRDNIPKMIEINPRLPGTTESSIVAGMDFPYMLYKMALGERIRSTYRYKLNRKFRWLLFAELFYLLKTRNKLATLKRYTDFRNTRTEIDFADIKPHIIQFLGLLVNRQVM